MVTCAVGLPRRAPRTFGSRLGACTSPRPSAPNSLKPPIPSGGGSVTPASPHRAHAGWRNVDRPAIAFGASLRLRTRLTRGRLASPRKPWPFGGGGSHPPYRYLYLHLPFLTLQHASRQAFYADRNAPLPMHMHPAASATCLIPDYYPCPVPRPVSCYALFE